jgi:hypothetical protein
VLKQFQREARAEFHGESLKCLTAWKDSPMKSSFSFFECRDGDINWQGVYFRGAAGILLADRILTSETAEKGSMGPDLWFLWRGPGGAP